MKKLSISFVAILAIAFAVMTAFTSKSESTPRVESWYVFDEGNPELPGSYNDTPEAWDDGDAALACPDVEATPCAAKFTEGIGGAPTGDRLDFKEIIVTP
jgi:hypothetical protein